MQKILTKKKDRKFNNRWRLLNIVNNNSILNNDNEISKLNFSMKLKFAEN
jgi:hypothetical protein